MKKKFRLALSLEWGGGQYRRFSPLDCLLRVYIWTQWDRLRSWPSVRLRNRGKVLLWRMVLCCSHFRYVDHPARKLDEVVVSEQLVSLPEQSIDFQDRSFRRPDDAALPQTAREVSPSRDSAKTVCVLSGGLV